MGELRYSWGKVFILHIYNSTIFVIRKDKHTAQHHHKNKTTTLKKLIILFLLLIGGICKGQNLVPNPSFEIDTLCPDTGSELNYAPPWYAVGGDPDYFNSCDGSMINSVGVPLNILGFQSARTGVAYAGQYFYGSNIFSSVEGKEYMQVQLIDTLIEQHIYCVSYYVSLANPYIFHYNNVAITEMGMYISNDTVNINTLGTLPYTPQIQSPAGVYLNDTINWMEISGQYTAHGGEKYITIGNFKFHSDTIGVRAYTNPNYANMSYYYIDDVSLVDCGTVGINEFQISNLQLYPNPITDKLAIQTNTTEPFEIILYDLSSRKLLQQSFTTTTIINTESLAKGMYIYQVRNKKGISKTGKVIKE